MAYSSIGHISNRTSSNTATPSAPKPKKGGTKRCKSGDELAKISTPVAPPVEAPEPPAAQDSDDSGEEQPLAKRQFTHRGDGDDMNMCDLPATVEYEPKSGNRARIQSNWIGAQTELQKRVTPAAIGPSAKIFAGSDRALVDALVARGIKPSALQRQHNQTEWPNKWITHVTCKEALRLPVYSSDVKAVFTNPSGPLFFFLWGLIPCEKDNLEASNYRFLCFLAHTPAIGPLLSSTEMPFLKGLTIPNAPGETATKVKVSNVMFQGLAEENWGYCSSDFIVHVPKIPVGSTMTAFWKNSTTKVVAGEWENLLILLSLSPPCATCGVEQHSDGGNCEFLIAIDVLTDCQRKGTSNGGVSDFVGQTSNTEFA
ncbi:hypothetical protein PtB15_11B317 [Puccinia triticina]|nr:hypothetical protein PtB15_11B317 [Puccinia triticina]